MNRSSKIVLSAAAASLSLALASFPAIASQNHGQKSVLPNKNTTTQMDHRANHGMMKGHMMQMMQRMHATKGYHMGKNMMGNHMGNKMMGHNMKVFDTDENGSITPEERRNGLLAELKKYDTDSDGTLSIAEFETLHSAHIRNKMVDRFQALDEDGDGKVSEAEMTAGAKKMEKPMKHHSSATHMNRMKQMHGSTPENN
jgi:Ca2+-binding EF-hand superfamily protein